MQRFNSIGETSERLSANLIAVIALLRKPQITRWADWMADALARLDDCVTNGFADILAAYGGMGSFNDLVIYSRDGPDQRGDAADLDDKQQVARRKQIWLDARALSKTLKPLAGN